MAADQAVVDFRRDLRSVSIHICRFILYAQTGSDLYDSVKRLGEKKKRKGVNLHDYILTLHR